MRSIEKKVAIGLVVVFVALVSVYVLLPDLGRRPNDAMLGPGLMAAGERPGGMSGRMSAAGGRGGAEGISPADAGCATSGGGSSVKTQEFGKPGAKLEIVALLPITHGCHVATEAELKKIQKQHPNDIHLTIVDLFGPEAPKYQEKVGGGRTLVSINGKTEFDLAGRRVVLERQEGMTYQVADLPAIIGQELRAK